MGAWIEIFQTAWFFIQAEVAPLVGAWIEINSGTTLLDRKNVAPLGLKYNRRF